MSRSSSWVGSGRRVLTATGRDGGRGDHQKADRDRAGVVNGDDAGGWQVALRGCAQLKPDRVGWRRDSRIVQADGGEPTPDAGLGDRGGVGVDDGSGVGAVDGEREVLRNRLAGVDVHHLHIGYRADFRKLNDDVEVFHFLPHRRKITRGESDQQQD